MRLYQSPLLRDRLERQVQTRTGRRIRNLVIEMRREAVILRGETTSYYLKQLAQHGVRDILPYVGLENAIAVEGSPGAGSPARLGSLSVERNRPRSVFPR